MAVKLVNSIDIGFSGVKVAQLDVSGESPRLVQLATASYPREAPGPVAREMIVETLRRLLDDRGLRIREAALALPRSQVTFKRLSDFPANVTSEQIGEIVAIRSEIELPFGGNPIVYDYHVIQQDPTQTIVDLVGARRSVVEEYLAILEAQEIGVIAVVPSTQALGFLLARMRARREESPSQRVPWMALDIGAGRTDLLLIRAGRVVFSRSFPLAGDRLTQRYAETYGVDFAEAERLKREQGRLDESLDPTDPAMQWAGALAREIELSVHAASQETLGELTAEPAVICLFGGGAQLPGLPEFLASRLEDRFEAPPRVEMGNPSEALPTPGESDGASQGQGALALGLGLQIAAGEVVYDLIPHEIKEKRSRERQQRRVLAYAAAVLLLLLALAWGTTSWVSSKVESRRAVELALQEARASYTAVEEQIQKDFLLVDLVQPKLSPLDVLLELTEKLPSRKQVALKSFTLLNAGTSSGGTLTFQLEANSHQDISLALNALRNSPLFASVRSGQVMTVEKNKRPVLQTQVSCVLDAKANDWIAQRRRSEAQAQIQVASLPPISTGPSEETESEGEWMDESFVVPPLLLDDEEPSVGGEEPGAPISQIEEEPPGAEESQQEEILEEEPEQASVEEPPTGASPAEIHPVSDDAVMQIEVEKEGNR